LGERFRQSCAAGLARRGRSRFVGAAGLAALAAFILAAQGCSTSSPRFTTTPVEDARVAEEERARDDVKVDAESFVSTSASAASGVAITPAGVDRDHVLLDIVDLLGTPYRYGGMDRDGMDCSGFTSRVYREASLPSLSRSTRDQFKQGRPVQRDSLQFGDLVFFNTTGDSPSHVGLFIEDDVFAHASVSFGVTLSSLQSTYYKERFVGARRVVR
jgi:cell wall-associated NlpC family hydrolase